MADPTIIDAGTRIDGRLEGNADVTIEGRVDGEIELSEALTVAQGGLVRGNVQVREARIEGAVDGDVVASERIVLAASAQVVGSLEAPALQVADGARFSGEILMDLEAQGGATRTTRAAAGTSRTGARTSTASTGGATGGAQRTATSTTTTTTTTVEEESEAAEAETAEEPAITEMSAKELEEYTVKELREELRERDLQVSGTKDELIDRLQGAGEG